MTRVAAAFAFAVVLGACSADVPSELARSAVAPAATVSATESATTPSVSPNHDPTPIPHSPAGERNEQLRDELLAMMAEDQAVRTGIAPPGDDRTAEELFAALNAVDRANGTRMREILDEVGWPGWSMVGEDGALAAWVLIQHADLDPELQEHGLALLMGAVDADDASSGDLAYLIDRVRVAKGLPQLYGTQISTDAEGAIVPRTPIEDPDNVDARRAAAGLGTLDEYYEELRAMALPSGSPAPSASE